MAEAGLDENVAGSLLESAGEDLRVALVMSKTGRSRAQAEEALAMSMGVVARAIESLAGRV